MKKIYFIPAILFTAGAICLGAFSIIGSKIAADGTLIEPFFLLPLAYLSFVGGIIISVIVDIWFWFNKKSSIGEKILTVLGLLILIIIALFISFSQNTKNSVAIKIIDDKSISAKDATYLIEGQPVTLVNGLSESGTAEKTITRYFGNGAIGDLNGDNLADSAFLLTQDNGGSGTFYYIAVALADDKGYQGINTILLGDRVAPQSTEIKEGKLIVNYADRKIDESFATQPSIGISKYFQVVNNQLTEINIPAQLTNRSWKWIDTKMNNDEIIAPKRSDAFSINFKDDGSVTGTTDCNSFFGKYEISGNKITLSSLGSTEMFCDGSQEGIFTKYLSEVSSYLIDKDNNLILQLKMDSGRMIFK